MVAPRPPLRLRWHRRIRSSARLQLAELSLRAFVLALASTSESRCLGLTKPPWSEATVPVTPFYSKPAAGTPAPFSSVVPEEADEKRRGLAKSAFGGKQSVGLRQGAPTKRSTKVRKLGKRNCIAARRQLDRIRRDSIRQTGCEFSGMSAICHARLAVARTQAKRGLGLPRCLSCWIPPRRPATAARGHGPIHNQTSSRRRAI